MKLKKCIVCNNKETTFLYTNFAMMHHSNKEYNFFICKICNLVFLNPRPTLKELKNYYTDYYLPYRGSSAWGKFSKLVDLSQRNLDTRRAKLITQFKIINKSSIILDVGCGKPTFLKSCDRLFKCKLYGLDFSSKGWDKEPKRFERINLSVGGIDDLNNTLKPDVISLWHYLEHDYYPNNTLKKLASISKSKTLLFLEVPNYDSISRKKYKNNWAGYHTPRHTFLFSPKNLDLLLTKCGWKVKQVILNGTLDSYNLFWMSKMEIKQIDWSKSMEKEFWKYVFGNIMYKLKYLFNKKVSHGVMTIIAERK